MGKQRNKTKGARFLTTFKFDIRSKRDFPSSPDDRRIKGVVNAVNSVPCAECLRVFYVASDDPKSTTDQTLPRLQTRRDPAHSWGQITDGITTMQAIGLCRFSYPALGGFQIKHDAIEDRIAYLYAAERIEERLRLFEVVALPCMAAQTDPRWEMIIVIGDSLPKHYSDRLHDLVAGIPQISIQVHAPRPQREVMKEIFNTARADPSQPCLQFRYDDDDAVSVDFIERFRESVDDCAGLNTKHQAVAYDWHKGFVAQFGPAGIMAHELHHKQNVASLGVHIRGGSKMTIMNFAHHRIDLFMPVVNFGNAPMWVESYNGFNDSPLRQRDKIPFAPLTPEQVGEFEARFAISEDAVKAVFSS